MCVCVCENKRRRNGKQNYNITTNQSMSGLAVSLQTLGSRQLEYVPVVKMIHLFFSGSRYYDAISPPNCQPTFISTYIFEWVF